MALSAGAEGQRLLRGIGHNALRLSLNSRIVSMIRVLQGAAGAVDIGRATNHIYKLLVRGCIDWSSSLSVVLVQLLYN